jgi:ribosomal protein S18 acetylase RimI-like enzyme
VTGPPPFRLPADLAGRGFSLRPESDDDLPFLTALYASTREAELSASPWTSEVKAAFLQMQFNAQRHHYRSQMPDCAWLVLEHEGAPAGRLYLEARDDSLHIVDIALMPEWRGMGVGAAILNALKALADTGHVPLCLFVEKLNPALNLYRRLGFVEIGDTGVYFEMEWAPNLGGGSASGAPHQPGAMSPNPDSP